MFVCVRCGNSFTRLDNLRRHERQVCGENSADGPALKRQRLESTQNVVSNNFYCRFCEIMVPARLMTSHVRTLQHRTNSSIRLSDGIHLIQSAFNSRIASYRVTNGAERTNFPIYLSEIKARILEILENSVRIHHSVKVNMEVFGKYILPSQEVSDVKSFHTSNIIVDEGSDMEAIYADIIDTIVSQTSEFQEKDSGWAIEEILYAEVNINKYAPMGGSSYIKLPKFIEDKKAVINVCNHDQHCFAWAITSALFPVESRAWDLSSYRHYSEHLNVTGMNFPVTFKDISVFEKLNPHISVNVFGLDNKFESNKVTYEIVGPLRHTRKRKRCHINLLYITNDKGNGHYCWIKDLSRLVSSQISGNEHRKFICDGCLLHFSTKTFLKIHQDNSCSHVYTVLPTESIRIDKFGKEVPENVLKFENFEKQIEVPFVVYADFESVLKPISTCEPDPKKSFTNKTFNHEPYSFSYLIKSSFDDSITKFVSYRGKDVSKEFVSRLETDLRELYFKYLKDIVPIIPLSSEEEREFRNAKVCNICQAPFDKGDVKVRDHCHITGKQRFGAAHSICNLHYKVPNFVPIIFHNMSGYDSHLFIKQLCSHGDKIDVIAQNKEKYISFTKQIYLHDYINKKGETSKRYLQLRFIDSFKFLSASLQDLSDGLSSEDFIETKKCFGSGQEFELMRQKGVFPYCFVDDTEKLNLTSLPSKADFYDNLKDEHISDEEYNRGVTIWNTFKCKTLGDYSDLYLKTDVLLLCDVFQSFRRKCLNIYKLDPAHYYTSPGLSWDAMLKYTQINLELLTDIDMIKFFKNGIRGGISQCSERMHVANNKYLPNYDPNEKSTFISYLDATNLYGHSMSQRLPTGKFKWLSEEEVSVFDVQTVPEESNEGFILEVDVDYPVSLHDAHKDFPFLVESIIPPNAKSKIPKLIPNLNNKRNYIVHYKNLKQALSYGLIVTKIHRILKFEQSFWLKKYIDLNTQLRNSAKTKFERDLYKLMNNAVFGKTMENVDNRRDIKLVTHWHNIRKGLGARALIARPNFKTLSIFHDNFVAIHMERVKVSYFKPIYIGFCILELSKTVMYDFFYGVIKHNFGERTSLLYTDTDSLILKIETDDFYTFINENIDSFDTSNYKTDNIFNVPVTESRLGKMKDEFPADPIQCFYGTGAKAYYVQSINSELKKAKGVKKCVIKKHLSSDDYKNVIQHGWSIMRKMNAFKSNLHDMYTEIRNKIALCHNDDKRFIIPNSIKTLPWGHSDITFYQTDPDLNVQLVLQALNNTDNDVDLVDEVTICNKQLAKSESNSDGDVDLVEEVYECRKQLTENENSKLDLLISLMLRELDS